MPSVSGTLSSDLVNLLGYEVFQGHFLHGQQFWINSKSTGLFCQTVNTNGRLGSVLCIQSLPALCTQSGNSTTTPTLQTTVSFHGLTITG